MIISPYYRFVFVAVPKTGTTSIEEALKKNLMHRCPSPLYAKITATRSYQFLYRKTRDVVSLLPPPSHLPVSFKHESVLSLGSIRPQDIMSFKTVAFVRNPWARLVSQYKQFQRPYFLHYEKRRKLHEASLISFAAFVHQYVEDPRPMWKFLCNKDGEVAVDYLGRFENLDSDFSVICKQLGLPSIELDHLNPARGKKQRYQEYYTPSLLELVTAVLEKDATLFGYSFDEST